MNILIKFSFEVVRFVRNIRMRLKILSLRLRGVRVDSTAIIDAAAIFEPSGGAISIGARTFIDRGVILRPLGGSIQIGDDCTVHAYSVLYGGGGLKILNGVRVAAHTVVVPSNHIFTDPDKLIKNQGLSLKGIVIHNDAWIGAGSLILDGVEVGEGTVVGAGSVVTRSTEPFSVVVGVPSKKISSRVRANSDS